MFLVHRVRAVASLKRLRDPEPPAADRRIHGVCPVASLKLAVAGGMPEEPSGIHGVRPVASLKRDVDRSAVAVSRLGGVRAWTPPGTLSWLGRRPRRGGGVLNPGQDRPGRARATAGCGRGEGASRRALSGYSMLTGQRPLGADGKWLTGHDHHDVSVVQDGRRPRRRRCAGVKPRSL